MIFFPKGIRPKQTIRNTFVIDRHAKYLSEAEAVLHQAEWSNVFSENFDIAVKSLYEITNNALSKFPKRRIKITNRDPDWKTPLVKDMEKRRSQLYSSGYADAHRAFNDKLTEQIEISRRNCVKNWTHVQGYCGKM